MDLSQSLRLSWRSIRGHRLRSTLTTLGVVIGIGAVITFVTLGASLQAGIIGDISPDDRQNVYVWASPGGEGGGPGAGAEPVFTQADVDALDDRGGIRSAYPYSPLPTQSISFGDQQVPRRDGIIATGPPYLDDGDFAEGRQFRQGEREVVLNPAMVQVLGGNVTVGDRVNVTLLTGQRTNATVVGVLETSESQGPFEGFGPSPRAYLPTDPYYTASVGDFVEEPRFLFVVLEAPSPDATGAAKDSARAYFDSEASDAGRIARANDLSFTMRTSTELLDQLREVLDQLQGFVVGIAAISLLVGAIGIANIMLVSVTERTREIGIMKAVGAQNRDVLGLFLVEAVVLGAIGAVFGTLVGLAGGWAITEYIDLPLVYPLEWFGVAIGVGVLVGVLSGLYPAWRAARTDPIEALRYE